ncbi:MAG: acyl-CoA dehydrogenase, partial [Chloroflexi bacterium]|nr:acyl-CoA dehydrogenase [Chloroflexota bacterium]
FLLAFYVVELIGKDEAGEINSEEASLLRLLTSINKLVTGRQGVMVTSEILEAHGGAGYVEDTGLPLLLRDAQVLPIWEGTTNVLALDTLRALRDDAPLAALAQKVQQCIQPVTDTRLATAGQVAQAGLAHAQDWLQHALTQGQPTLEAGARRFALTLGRSLELALLVEQAQWSLAMEGDGRTRTAACRFSRTAVDLITDDEPLNELHALANDIL